MPKFYATCASGLEELLAAELEAEPIRARKVEAGASGVAFEGAWATGYRACLWSRLAVRVLAEWAVGPAADADELYAWARELPWREVVTPDLTISVEARVRDSGLTHSKYASLRIKDALCDALRDETGRRPDVAPRGAQVPWFLALYKNRAVLYRDLCGESLHRRGYRDAMHKASLNECLAAALLRWAGFDGVRDVVDPMCGSGTLLFEAAWISLNRAPGLGRETWPFLSWPDTKPDLFRDIREETRALELAAPRCRLAGNDHHAGALSLAKRDSRTAGVERWISFNQGDVEHYQPPFAPSLVVCNPPWGERLEGEEEDDSDPVEPWRGRLAALGQQRPDPSPGDESEAALAVSGGQVGMPRVGV
jgi:23S rRNA G2445 N2-methylase RlmL